MESTNSGSSSYHQADDMDVNEGVVDGTVAPDVLEKLIIEDDDEFLRLMFDSEAYKDGFITNEAIKTRDLQVSGFSLDIKRASSIEVIKSRAQSQSANILSKDPSSDKRRVPYISTLLNSEVINCKDEDGRNLFETLHTPEPDNYAHTSLYCILRDEGKKYYVYARNQIRPLLEKGIVLLSDYESTI